MGFLGVKWMDSRFLPRTTSQADMADGGEAATLGRVPLMDAQSKPPATSADGPGRRSEPRRWMLRRGAWSRGGGGASPDSGFPKPPTPPSPPGRLPENKPEHFHVSPLFQKYQIPFGFFSVPENRYHGRSFKTVDFCKVRDARKRNHLRRNVKKKKCCKC